MGDIFRYIFYAPCLLPVISLAACFNGAFPLSYYMPILKDIGIFKFLSDADIEETASLVSTESYGKKEQVFSEGDPSHCSTRSTRAR